MGALTLGPLVLSLDRAYAGLGFLVLLVGAEWLARRAGPSVAAWGWRAAAVAFVGARLGFVATHASDFAAAPLSALAFWQGGFAAWWGVAAAAAYTAYEARRTPALRRIAPAVGAAALIAWWVPAGLLSPATQDAGVVAPAYVLEALEGGTVDLAARGTPTVVNVWATWCPPCRRELPAFAAVAASTPDVRVLLVNQGEDPGTIATYLAREGLPTSGVLLDRRQTVGTALQVAGLPTTFAFDAQGRLVDVHVGEISAAALRSMVASLR
jgi:thiol-disulfide isomerase/thioredoxin